MKLTHSMLLAFGHFGHGAGAGLAVIIIGVFSVIVAVAALASDRK